MAFLQNFWVTNNLKGDNDFIKAEINKTESTFLKGKNKKIEDFFDFYLEFSLKLKCQC